MEIRAKSKYEIGEKVWWAGQDKTGSFVVGKIYFTDGVFSYSTKAEETDDCDGWTYIGDFWRENLLGRTRAEAVVNYNTSKIRDLEKEIENLERVLDKKRALIKELRANS